jgi:type VI secretion system protein ImpK
MQRVTEVTKDCFNAIAQLRQLDDASLPQPEAVHRRLRSFVDALMQRGAQAGFGRDDVNDIAYAVVALADEVAMSKTEDLRAFWGSRQLQLQYFQENVAGEGFFTRLEGVRRDPRRAEVLQVYYVALLVGFQGRYRVRGGELELMNLVQELQRDLARGRKTDVETLSPRGERLGERVARVGQVHWLLWAGLGAGCLALLLFVVLRIWVGSSASGVVDSIAAVNLP